MIISVGLLEPEYDLGMQIELIRAIRTRFPLVGLVVWVREVSNLNYELRSLPPTTPQIFCFAGMCLTMRHSRQFARAT